MIKLVDRIIGYFKIGWLYWKNRGMTEKIVVEYDDGTKVELDYPTHDAAVEFNRDFEKILKKHFDFDDEWPVEKEN